MSKLRVGVLRGGPSSEYEVSLLSGANVLSNLDAHKYNVKDIFIDKTGKWHLKGVVRPEGDILHQIDVAFLALHGEYGEDGKVQRLLDRFHIPYTGSGAMASALAMNKAHTKERLKELDIKMPRHRVLTVSPDLREQILDVMRSFSFPMIVKPNGSGSSVGLTLAKNQEALTEGIRKAFNTCRQVMIEEFIEGREATCGVLDNFRGEKIYSLLPIEIIPDHSEKLFDYDAKYSGRSKEICPGNFTKEEGAELQRISKLVHDHLYLRHYSRSDFMIGPRGIYFLEVNTLPGLTTESLLPKSIDAVGSSYSEFLDHLINLAVR